MFGCQQLCPPQPNWIISTKGEICIFLCCFDSSSDVSVSQTTFSHQQHVQLCFTHATGLTNQPPAQQDGVSHWAPSHVRSELVMFVEFLPHLEITSACQYDRWLQGESRWFKTTLEMFFFLFGGGLSGLAGVDCSIVCPLMELICLWGWCSKLSKVLNRMHVDVWVGLDVLVCHSPDVKLDTWIRIWSISHFWCY